MTKLIVETDNNWTKKKITDAIHTEKELLKKVLQRIESKIGDLRKNMESLKERNFMVKVDDMELVQWKREIETAARLKEHLLNQNQ